MKKLKSVNSQSLFKIANVQMSTPNYQCSKMSSYEAVKIINNLQKYDEPNMITKSFEIYSNLDETQKNEYVIVALLKCCKQMAKKKMDIITMNVINDIKSVLMNSEDHNVFAKRLLMSNINL